MAEDEVPNVRNAAVNGLFRLRGHDADEVLLAQLTQDDPQLLLTVAGLLEGIPNPESAVTPLRETLRRISADGRETMRDPRVGIIHRLAEVTGDSTSEVLGEYLSDFDPEVATLVAEILTTKTGEAHHPSPNPAPRLPFPSLDELDRLTRARVVLEMEGGGEIQIRLFPYMAATNAARFVRLAESGVFDGLTFHRVVSNFVVQGLSPNANEMAGHGAFTRDELGLQSNWRGTIGTSTRGRDTGDGQIYFNSVDNLRLDHNYTVFGEVVEGMDVVDDIVEGQVVLRARVIAR
jgi:cyclophilin family peptidyl-prolyl cis-trans isomerase